MSILTELKTQTRAEHDSIEQRLNLLDPGMDEKKYKDLLKGFYGFYVTVEEFLCFHPELYSEERRKLSSLQKDLLYFQIPPESLPTVSSEAIPHKSLEDVLGLLYVIEGSTLGGQVLSLHFQKKFNLVPGAGLDFFSGYGSQTMSKWLEMKSLIEGLVESKNLCKENLIHSAKTSFKNLENWLGKSI